MSALKLSEHVPGFLAYLENTRLSPLTKKCYVHELRLFAGYVRDCTVEELSPAVLLGWHGSLAKSKLAYSTCNQKRAALRKFLDYLDQFEESDQAAKLLRALDRLQVPGDKKPRREPYPLEDVTLTRLLVRAGLHVISGGRDVAILRFMWAAGVRRAEVASLLFDNVDLEERVATVVGKGDKERLVVFDEKCQRSLDLWLRIREESWPKREGVDTFFITIDGYQMKPDSVSAVFSTCAEEAGLKGQVWPHLFRHSSITRMANSGANILEVAAFHGHENVNTTKGYYHADVTSLKAMYDRANKAGRQEP
jgi:integrase/recombinase XerC